MGCALLDGYGLKRTPHSQKYSLCKVYRKPGETVDEMNECLARMFSPSTKGKESEQIVLYL